MVATTFFIDHNLVYLLLLLFLFRVGACMERKSENKVIDSQLFIFIVCGKQRFWDGHMSQSLYIVHSNNTVHSNIIYSTF